MAPNAPAPTTAEIIGGIYNVTPPVLLDGQAAAIQIDVNGNIKTSGGGGGGNVNVTGINSVAPALTNPLPVELSDGALAVGTPSNPLTSVQHRLGQILTSAPLGSNGIFTSAWFDTSQTGDVFVQAGCYTDQNGANPGLIIQQTDDTTNTRFQFTLASAQVFTGGSGATCSGVVTRRYWRVIMNNGGTAQGLLEVVVNTSPSFPFVSGQNGGGGSTALITTPAFQQANIGDTGVLQPFQLAFQAGSSFGQLCSYVVPLSNLGVATRIPSFFKTSAATNAGNTAAWTPAAGKKFRLMRYQIELSADATLAVAALITVKFQDNVTDFGFQHDQWLPVTGAPGAAVIGEAWRSGWIDIGNGYLSTVANNVLNFNIGGGNNLTAGKFRINVCGTEE